jgi:hypothetical protein
MTYCPICIQTAKQTRGRLLGRGRRMHKLTDGCCPVHGRFDLAEANRLAWWVWRRHNLVIMTPVPDGKGIKVYRRLDYAGVQAVLNMYAVSPERQAEELERLELLFQASLQQS